MVNPGGTAIGEVLAGKYRVERVLGQGGMGIVVRAKHLQLDQPVAIKLLLSEAICSDQVARRFLREAQAAVRLKSEHVARVLDVGTLHSGAPFMVLEYLEGSDLACFPRSELTVGGIVDLVLQACEGLAEAHALGIVHRDIKPGNFFIIRGPCGALMLKVLDFGISKVPTRTEHLTGTQMVMGTPAYMSPEQMRSPRDVDHRCDIWSLGVVMYELLEGILPFGSDASPAMVLKVVGEPPPELTVRLPDGLDAVIYRCLEKSPQNRFQNVAELAGALARYAQSELQAAISVQRTRVLVEAPAFRATCEVGHGRHTAPSTISRLVTARTVPLHQRRRSSRTWIVVLAIVVVVAIAQLIGGGETGQGSLQPTSPGASNGAPESSRRSSGPSWDPGIAPAPMEASASPRLPDAPTQDGSGSPGFPAAPPQRPATPRRHDHASASSTTTTRAATKSPGKPRNAATARAEPAPAAPDSTSDEDKLLTQQY